MVKIGLEEKIFTIKIFFAPIDCGWLSNGRHRPYVSSFTSRFKISFFFNFEEIWQKIDTSVCEMTLRKCPKVNFCILFVRRIAFKASDCKFDHFVNLIFLYNEEEKFI